MFCYLKYFCYTFLLLLVPGVGKTGPSSETGISLHDSERISGLSSCVQTRDESFWRRGNFVRQLHVPWLRTRMKSTKCPWTYIQSGDIFKDFLWYFQEKIPGKCKHGFLVRTIAMHVAWPSKGKCLFEYMPTWFCNEKGIYWVWIKASKKTEIQR